MKKKYIDYEDINNICDQLIRINDIHIDEICDSADVESSLKVISGLAIERKAFRKFRNSLLNLIQGEDKDG